MEHDLKQWLSTYSHPDMTKHSSISICINCSQGGINFPLPFYVLLSSLKIKLIWDRLVGYNHANLKYICIYIHMYTHTHTHIWSSPKWLRPSPYMLKTSEDIEGRGLGLQREGRQFTEKWKSKYLVNKHLMGHAEMMGQRVTLISRPSWVSSTIPSQILHRYLWW